MDHVFSLFIIRLLAMPLCFKILPRTPWSIRWMVLGCYAAIYVVSARGTQGPRCHAWIKFCLKVVCWIGGFSMEFGQQKQCCIVDVQQFLGRKCCVWSTCFFLFFLLVEADSRPWRSEDSCGNETRSTTAQFVVARSPWKIMKVGKSFRHCGFVP